MGAQPKRRLTRSRRRRRRNQIRVASPTLVRCPTCHALMRSHHVCVVCGNLRGTVVVEPSEQAAKYR